MPPEGAVGRLAGPAHPREDPRPRARPTEPGALWGGCRSSVRAVGQAGVCGALRAPWRARPPWALEPLRHRKGRSARARLRALAAGRPPDSGHRPGSWRAGPGVKAAAPRACSPSESIARAQTSLRAGPRGPGRPAPEVTCTWRLRRGRGPASHPQGDTITPFAEPQAQGSRSTLGPGSGGSRASAGRSPDPTPAGGDKASQHRRARQARGPVRAGRQLGS